MFWVDGFVFLTLLRSAMRSVLMFRITCTLEKMLFISCALNTPRWRSGIMNTCIVNLRLADDDIEMRVCLLS